MAGRRARLRVRTRQFTKVDHTMTSGIAVGTHPKRTDGPELQIEPAGRQIPTLYF